jgi:D-inositol-3-phosphate glycosyltransferase
MVSVISLPGSADRRRGVRVPRRIAVLSIHTSPLDPPGTGDAGGMNVYVAETARRLAQRGTQVDIFTRATESHLHATVSMDPGVTVHHVTAGPFEGLRKEDLPAQLCAVTSGVLRAEAARPTGWYDLIHSHYWLSGQVGWLAAERWNVPLIHTMHTMARVKNLELADGDTPEPITREIGEQQVVDASDRLIANTADEAAALIGLYGAEEQRVDIVHPGADLDVFSPGDRAAARRRLDVAADAALLVFVGRIQPLKAPDVLVRAVASMLERDPALRDRLVVAVCGGPSGSGLDRPDALTALASSLGIADVVRFEPPRERTVLADWFRAADLTVVPSYSESFGLVALESQACGTPVVAARVGGLRTSVADGVSGVLIDGHDPRDYAAVISDLLDHPARLRELARGARAHAEHFSWDATTSALLESYDRALVARRAAQRTSAR